ncbi:MAG: sel1 repeat family protein [Kordiimonadaceae bacterium]|nr:sel1 repeat family protein [Kordiimonadaceae bacterium]
MSKILKIAALLALVFISWNLLSKKSFDEGLIAYRSGDYKTAYDIFIDEAENGNINAAYNVGYMYKNALAVDQDLAEAVKWLKAASEGGHAIAQNELGQMAKNGEGMPVNYDEAMSWFLKSADQGYFGAQFNIGQMFYQGSGVEQSYEQALNWYLLAAGQGMTAAQRSLGVMYKLGQGTLPSNLYAFMWLYIAKERGDGPAASLLDSYTKEMDVDTVTQAITLANQWIANHPG